MAECETKTLQIGYWSTGWYCPDVVDSLGVVAFASTYHDWKNTGGGVSKLLMPEGEPSPEHRKDKYECQRCGAVTSEIQMIEGPATKYRVFDIPVPWLIYLGEMGHPIK